MANYYFSLPDDLLDAYRERSRTLGLPVAELVRQAMWGWLAGSATVPCGFVMSGLIASGTVMVFRGN